MLLAVPSSSTIAEDDQTVRFSKRQRPKQHRVDDAEDRGVGADAECQCDERGNREAGGAHQHPDAVSSVPDERLQRRQRSLGGVGFRHLTETAKSRPCLTVGVVWISSPASSAAAPPSRGGTGARRVRSRRSPSELLRNPAARASHSRNQLMTVPRCRAGDP